MNVLRIRFILQFFTFVYIWNNGLVQVSSEVSENMKKMKSIKDKLLKEYDKLIRPTKENSNTTQLMTAFIPRQIIQLNEETAIFTMDLYFWMSWDDPRLQWNETDFDGYLQLPTSLLWVPDISVFNSHSVQVNPAQDVLVVINKSGIVYWVPPILTQTACPSISAAPYPGDEVECEITIGSWAHDGFEIDFDHSEEIYMSEFVNIHPRWELITSRTRTLRNVTYYEGYDEPYLCLQIFFPMKRRPVPEIEATRVPCILIMLLTLAIFWLPPDSSKKVLLGGILFLVLNMLQVYVAWSTKYPLAVVFAITFLQSTMYLVVVTILLQILIVSKLCSLSGPTRPPPAVMLLLSGPIGKYACLRSPFSDSNIPLDRILLKEESAISDSPTPRDEWMLFAEAVDRCLFVVMAIAMIAVHHL